jgi:outer membrane immunogenic protein
MSMDRDGLLCAVLAVALSSGVAKADSTEGPWTGFYVGAQGGQIAGSARGTLSHIDPFVPGLTADDIFASTSRSIGVKGGTVSLQGGYDYQTGFMVFGIEADMAWAGANGSVSATTIDTLTTWNIESKLYSLGTLRGRVGVTAGPSTARPASHGA